VPLVDAAVPHGLPGVWRSASATRSTVSLDNCVSRDEDQTTKEPNTMTTTPSPEPLRAVKTSVSKHHRRAARDEIKKGVKHLEKSIGEIEKGLRKAEREIAADARLRVRALRKEARAAVAALRVRRRDVARELAKVVRSEEGSLEKVKQSADVILAEAVDVAAAIVQRLKKSLPRA
jgi:hypothetical protein